MARVRTTKKMMMKRPKWMHKFIRREGDLVIRKGVSYKAKGLLECLGRTKESMMRSINRAVQFALTPAEYELVVIEEERGQIIIRVKGPVDYLQVLFQVTSQHEAVWSHIMGCPVRIRSVTASNHKDIEKWLKCPLLYTEHGGETFPNLSHRAFMQNLADGGWTVVKYPKEREEVKMYFPYDRM